MAEALSTSTSAASEHFPTNGTAAPRPQPVGLFPLPLGYMLIPAGEGADPVREAMLAGRLPEQWPASLRAHELAAAGERDAAIAELHDFTDPVATYNRFVLAPDSVDPDTLRSELGEYGPLVDVGRCVDAAQREQHDVDKRPVFAEL